MSKHFFSLGQHEYGSDFYRDVVTDSVFRAETPELAAKIAFNQWLESFNNIGHSADNVVVGEGYFTVDVHKHASSSGITLDTETIRHDVVYYGPSDMFTPQYQLEHSNDSEIQQMRAAMEQAFANNHPSVRLSRGKLSLGKRELIFSEMVKLPYGYQPDGTYISSENRHLSTNPQIARLQMAAAGIEWEK